MRNDIDWNDMKKTLDACAKEVIAKGYRSFGIEYYGECWFDENIDHNTHGPSPGGCSFGGVGAGDEFAYYTIST